VSAGAAPVGWLKPGEGHIFGELPGMQSVFKAGAASTDGHLSMTEESIPPGFSAQAHRHLQAVELFYVVDGELEFRIDEGRITMGAGRLCCVGRSRADQQ
jgi:quercetin dioxygenase-like cupin family protein